MMPLPSPRRLEPSCSSAWKAIMTCVKNCCLKPGSSSCTVSARARGACRSGAGSGSDQGCCESSCTGYLRNSARSSERAMWKEAQRSAVSKSFSGECRYSCSPQKLLYSFASTAGSLPSPCGAAPAAAPAGVAPAASAAAGGAASPLAPSAAAVRLGSTDSGSASRSEAWARSWVRSFWLLAMALWSMARSRSSSSTMRARRGACSELQSREQSCFSRDVRVRYSCPFGEIPSVAIIFFRSSVRLVSLSFASLASLASLAFFSFSDLGSPPDSRAAFSASSARF
mmetsp:Transcript_15962/g.45647  ORF Transcript_15962/g.45647 Transcript_15962/m.45647 type:complete len:284 (-) Transcript_15962:600-1451(-)